MALDPERLDFLRRNSTLRLDKAGRWSMNDKLVEHPRVQKLFHRGIRAADDGYTLHVGTQWAYIQFVEDTAFFVRRAELNGAEVRLHLLDDTVETLDPKSLARTSDSDVYCTVKGGHRARFLASALVDLMAELEEHDGGYALNLGGALHPIPSE